jgi:glutathione peroxidase
MKRFAMAAAAVVLAGAFFGSRAAAAEKSEATEKGASPLDYTVKDIDGKDTDLSQYKGKVVLIVNVASKCGYTPQYKGLEKLYEDEKDKGFVILGFPANNFKGQEPGTDAEIKQFCEGKYNVTFPMMDKVSVKGDDKHPVYKTLTEGNGAQVGPQKGEVTWNFNKFLIGKDGKEVAHFDSKVKPDSDTLAKAIDAELAK